MANVGYATLQIIPSVRGISDDLRRQLIGPAADAGEEAGRQSGGGFKESFQGAMAALGVAELASKMGEQLTEAFNEAMEQSSLTSTLQAQLGATGKDAARYGKVAGQLYAKGITEDVAGGAEVIRSIVNAGLVPPDATNKQLDSIATKMSDVSTTFGTDMSMQTQAVSALMKNGLAPSASSALDVITVGMQKLGPNAEDLLETFQEYPVQLKKLGLDANEALGLFRQGLQGGARDTDIIADALKEFSIRSIDMSASSRAAYKSLGLDAQTMEAMIGKGGQSAQQGLQIVLDKLRGIHDPVKREAAAVGLFGTQAEELSTSLFKLDPSKATKTMGDVSGAATNLGKTIRSGPSYEITVFQRALKQGLVSFIGGQVLPVITTLARGFNTYLLPPIRTVGSALGATLIPALSALFNVGAGVVGWLRDMGTWLIPIGIAVGGFTAAILAQQIATAATTAVFSIYRGAILAWTGVQRIATAAQWLFNAAMNANPITLVIVAIVALGAALVVAYQKVGWFRALVQAAWSGIQTGALFMWNSVLKPTFAAIWTALQAVGKWATWLWQNAISPAFNFIVAAGRILLTALVTIVLLPIIAAVKLVGAIAMWLWHNALQPAFQGIATVALWLWTNAIHPVINWIVAGFQLWWAGINIIFGYFKAGIRAIGSVALWLYNNAIKPAWNGVVTASKWLWNNGVKPILNVFMQGLRTLGSVGTWLYRNAVQPAWSGIRSAISTVWNSGIRPTFDALKKAVGLVGKSFGTAKDAIKVAWDKIQGIARKPVQFIVDTVYNKGIVGVWNKVAGAFGAPKLSKFAFASGGVMPGYTPGRDVHLAALSGGEAIMRPEWTRAVGPGYVNSMNAAARGGGIAGVQRALGLPGYADGGIFGWVKGAASKGVDLVKAGASWLKDGVKASALAGLNKVVKPLIEKISGSASLYKDMIKGVPQKMMSTILDFSGKADSKLEAAGIGGGGYKAGLSWARTQAGKRYQWGGNGNPSWDCSGFVSAIESVIRGQKPHRRWATGAFGATGPAGWRRNARSPYMIGITNAGVGHTAGTLNGVNVESRGGDGVVVGKRARGYSNGLFTSRWGYVGKYDSGGWLQPGMSTVVNKTGRPEAVLTNRQWEAVTRGGGAGGGASYNYTINARTADFSVADLDRVQRIQEARARVGRPR